MTVHSFQESDILAFVNKLMQDMKSTFRADTVEEFNKGDSVITCKSEQGKLVAEISDFGMGDIGFKSIAVVVGDKTLNYVEEKQPALSARILPSEKDYRAFISSISGDIAAHKSVEKINAFCHVKMADSAQVIKDGVAMQLKEFEVLRPRPAKGNSLSAMGM